jgi:GH35 family endo-1,4-beta-xylanase
VIQRHQIPSGILRPAGGMRAMVTGTAVALLILCGVPAHGQSDTIQTNVPHLKDVYAGDFSIGCILSYRHVGFPDDPPVPGQSAVITPNGGHLIRFHMNSMSPGNNMKPQYTVDIAGSAAAYAAATTDAERDSIETHPIIRFNGDLIAQLNWAQRQGFTFRGHTLVWHSQTPATLFRSGYASGSARLTKARMIERMDNYIKEVIRLLHESWPGLLSAMDVVNEAVTDAGADRTTDSEWYITFGDNSYLLKAFEIARKYTVHYGENQIRLYYNDYNTHIAAKADGVVRICTPIFQAGYLDGIGMQEHDANASPTAEAWIASYTKFDPICTEMAVTELDVTTGSASPSPAVLATQANQYGQLFKCFVERSHFSGRGKIISVSKDGLNDQYTFKTGQSSSIWDAQNQCKPSFYAVANVGIGYRALDSLIVYADGLVEVHYTSGSWAPFAATLASARLALARNYSASLSAADTLASAKNILQARIEELVPLMPAVNEPDGLTPQRVTLSQNYPNPFNPTTNIRLTIVNRHLTIVKVFDALGREVATLLNEVKDPGTYTLHFDGSQLPSGIYFYRLQAGDVAQTRRLVLLR